MGIIAKLEKKQMRINYNKHYCEKALKQRKFENIIKHSEPISAKLEEEKAKKNKKEKKTA